MATERPGLLSKVAMFVRNPTKDWSELDKPEPQEDVGYDKASLKAMIERKRQNDFVRKREFDQLRKLRRRDPGAGAALIRPSFFQSSMPTDPDGRADTLKKIDEIEAQMSKQWWKGKQDGVKTRAGEFPVTSQGQATPSGEIPPDQLPTTATPLVRGPATAFAPTEAVSLRAEDAPNQAEFVPTRPAEGALAEEGMRSPPVAPGTAQQGTGNGIVGFSTSRLFAIETDELATDPELEEAAIRFANGDDSGAEAGLLAALRAEAIMPDSALSWAAALLDFYRATNQRAGFEQAAEEFAMRLDRVKPVWHAIGEAGNDANVSPKEIPPGSARVSGSAEALWSAAEDLSLSDMEVLRDALGSHPPPWHLDWSSISRIAPDAMPLVSGLFESLCAEQVEVSFSGAEHLVRVLRAMTPSGERAIDQMWWGARMNALRAMQMQDEFELTALDYCVTYEVSPPAWSDAKCLYSAASGSGQPGEVGVANAGRASSVELKGQVLGDATAALNALVGERRPGELVTVSCRGLVRVDFSAAGSILNWVAMRQAEGCQVQFRDVHRLVAAFFNVIGINEHARVIPRSL